jgi:glycosyltransferase involved in cell wall biosynthesis
MDTGEMRLLVLTFYYPPDLSAGAFRAGAVVAALRAQAPAATEIDVFTTAPNRYGTFAPDAHESESHAGLAIHRVKLPVHHSDMLGQSRAFLTFARAAIHFASSRQYALVYATSSRLLTAALGALIARRKQARLYLDIRDLFVDTIGDLLPRSVAGIGRTVFSKLEAYTMRGAARINLVSRGFEQYIRSRYPQASLSWFTNGIDEEFLVPLGEGAEPARRGPDAVVLYAGNIGSGQDLHLILPPLALALRGRARFVVIGDGGKRRLLESELQRLGVDTVQLRPPMSRVDLIRNYRAADVLFLHLGNRTAFEKVLPSKVFEYAAMRKPVLAGVAGFAARFIREHVSNAAVFPPGDSAAAVHAFESLSFQDTPRPEFVGAHARSGIAQAMARDILAVALRG